MTKAAEAESQATAKMEAAAQKMQEATAAQDEGALERRRRARGWAFEGHQAEGERQEGDSDRHKYQLEGKSAER